MKLLSSYIYLRQVRFYAFHGVLPQEQLVGGHYQVDLRVGYPFLKAMQTDEVGDTLNYAQLFQLIKSEMDVPSKLLEHVAARIVEAVTTKFPQVTSVDLNITKINPPMGADSQGAGVEVHFASET